MGMTIKIMLLRLNFCFLMYLEICIFGNLHKELSKFWLTLSGLNLFEI